MGIEVRQLVVKSNLVQRAAGDAREPLPQATSDSLEALRRSMLAECRKLIAEALRQSRER